MNRLILEEFSFSDMMYKNASLNVWMCSMCDFSSPQTTNLRNHIEVRRVSFGCVRTAFDVAEVYKPSILYSVKNGKDLVVEIFERKFMRIR